MPLNVQPLSRPRQIIRFVVLLALLGLSLGFAQYLTMHRRAHPPISFNLEPLGFTAPLMEDEPFDFEIEGRSGVIAGNPRDLRIFYGPYKASAETPFPLPSEFLKELSKIGGTTNSVLRIADRSWLEIYSHDADKSFIIVRFLIISDHALVICYSGDDRKTDADSSTLNALCTTAAHMDFSDLPQ